jgi:hypothetical protein
MTRLRRLVLLTLAIGAFFGISFGAPAHAGPPTVMTCKFVEPTVENHFRLIECYY